MSFSPTKKKILVVDDEPNVRQLVYRMLSKNYLIIEAANGEEAISLAQLEKPDLILMDMMMPGMDGLSACHAIKTDKDTAGNPSSYAYSGSQ